MELPEIISQGLQRLQQGQMQQGAFDVEAHHRNMLETGPFAEAKKRHSVWLQQPPPLPSDATSTPDTAKMQADETSAQATGRQ